MRVHDYSAALISILDEGKDTSSLLLDLKRVLKERGHERLYPKILIDLHKTLKRKAEREGITVILARESDEKKLEKEIREVVAQLGGGSHTTVIDPTLIGGFIAEGGEKRIDASYKRSLLALYQSLIA